MGIYGKFANELLESQQVVAEGKIINSIIKFCKDWKEFKVEEKKRKEEFKRVKKQNPGISDVDAWKKVYEKFGIYNKATKERENEKKKIFGTYNAEEKEIWKNAIDAFKVSFEKRKTKLKDGTKTDEGAPFEIGMETFSVSANDAWSDGVMIGYTYIKDGDMIEYDSNEELFDLFDSINSSIENDLKKFKVWSDSGDGGRDSYFCIDRKDLK